MASEEGGMPEAGPKLAKAIYRHAAEGVDELSFEPGEMLTIVGEGVDKGACLSI